MPARTLDNCSVISRMGKVPYQKDGVCSGFIKDKEGKNPYPACLCKRCKFYYLNVKE